uniref:Uncharacterized protein n=1 Tax=Strigamia maritima TaxID=126957 RepID=T1J1A9_STRMM
MVRLETLSRRICGNLENVEAILLSNSHIEKASDYNFLHPWLGTGLLTRFLVTLSFDVSVKFSTNKPRIEPSFDIFPFITLCTLDIICDAVMGRHVNAQGCDNSPYVKTTERINSFETNANHSLAGLVILHVVL